MHKLPEDPALWKRRFLTPQVYWTQVAEATPAVGLVGTDLAGMNQLYFWDVPTGELRRLTDRPEGVPFAVLAPDGRYAYYFQDDNGSEFGRWVRLGLTGGEPEDIAPDLATYSSWKLALSGSGKLAGFILAEATAFHVYCISIETNGDFGAPKMLYETPNLAEGPYLSYDGDVAVVASSERSGGLRFGLLALDIESGEAIGELWDGPGSNVNPRLFSRIAGDTRLLATTTRTGYRRPFMWNPRSGERTDLELGAVQGEVLPWDWSGDGQYILLCSAFGAVQRLSLYDLGSKVLHALDHPGGTYQHAYFATDGDIYAEWEDATHPRQLIALDRSTGRLKRTVLSVSDEMVGRPWRSVGFTSSGGQDIQGWLGVPEGDGPFPAIIEVHDGPASWVSEEYSPESQAWLDHGYAYLTINYRGSSSFGREFEEVVYGDPGHWEIDDMVAAREWMVRSGVGAPDRILLKGFSYGGYLVLQALGTRPGLWAGGIAESGIADWRLNYEDVADNMKAWQEAILGGRPAEMPERYADRSPITHAERVQAPVLVIHGLNDSRCPVRQMEAYLEKMHALGKSIQSHWFDAGHGTLVAQERQRHQELMLRFAERVISSASTASG